MTPYTLVSELSTRHPWPPLARKIVGMAAAAMLVAVVLTAWVISLDLRHHRRCTHALRAVEVNPQLRAAPGAPPSPALAAP